MQQAQQQPEWLAGQAFRELVYGKQNRLGQPSDGVPADVAKLTLAGKARAGSVHIIAKVGLILGL